MPVKKAHFLRYCIIGVINTVACFSVIYLLMEVLGIDYRISNVAGYCIGLAISFILNKYENFNSRGRLTKEIALFLTSFAAAYSVNLAVLIVAVGMIGLNEMFAQIVSGTCYTITFYLLMKGVVFKKGNALPLAE